MFGAEDQGIARRNVQFDIPRRMSASGDAVPVNEFYVAAHSAHPSHEDDIHATLHESDDLEVFAKQGGLRRKGHTISMTHTLRLKTQRSFFPMFGRPSSQSPVVGVTGSPWPHTAS